MLSTLTSRAWSITYYWGIFIVTAVIDAPSFVPTIENWSFVALTIYIIQPNLTTSSPKSGRPWSDNSVRIPELTANDTCIIYIPEVITNCSQVLLWNTSTLPSEVLDPPTNLKAEIIFNKMFSCNFWLLYYLEPWYKHHIARVNYT